MEIWKDIKGCENRYEVSTDGEVRHKDDKSEVEVWFFRGYKMVTLLTDNGRKKQFSIHRIVATAFIDNPLNKEQVNHKNAIRTDNRVENLEWVTARENLMHARSLPTRKPLIMKKGSASPLAIPIVQYSKSGEKIAEYGAMIEASQNLNIHLGDISSCCSGRRKTAGGFIFKYKEEL